MRLVEVRVPVTFDFKLCRIRMTLYFKACAIEPYLSSDQIFSVRGALQEATAEEFESSQRRLGRAPVTGHHSVSKKV